MIVRRKMMSMIKMGIAANDRKMKEPAMGAGSQGSTARMTDNRRKMTRMIIIR